MRINIVLQPYLPPPLYRGDIVSDNTGTKYLITQASYGIVGVTLSPNHSMVGVAIPLDRKVLTKISSVLI